jgi:hypothetical protein
VLSVAELRTLLAAVADKPRIETMFRAAGESGLRRTR